MKRLFVFAVAMVVVASLAIVGCNQAAPAPTQAPAAPTKAAQPTKAAAPAKAAEPAKAAAPTAAPAKKEEFSYKGKVVTWIAPWNAGSVSDSAARPMAELMEKDLGMSINYVNRPGAGLQVGMTELAQSKPDGLTMGYTTMPNVVVIYKDPDRKAVFNRSSFAPLAMHQLASNILVANVNTPYKTAKDLIDAGKANPGKIPVGTTGLMGDDHLALLQLQKVTGAKFAAVHFTGYPLKELLGGHVDAVVDNIGAFMEQFKAGDVRVLGIMAKEESKYYPGVKTLEAQGYKVYAAAARNLSMPAGTPKAAVDALSGSIERAMKNPAYTSRMEEMGIALYYMGPDELGKYWTEAEPDLAALLEEAKAEAKK